MNNLKNNIIILIDSREKSFDHIKEKLKKQNIKYKIKKLEYGDYSFEYKNNKEKINFEDKIVIERKRNLEEMTQSIGEYRDRFERELKRAKDDNCKFYLMIEDGNWRMLKDGVYDTQYNPKPFVATLKTYESRFEYIRINFIDSNLSAWWIYNTFKYYLRECLL